MMGADQKVKELFSRPLVILKGAPLNPATE